MKIRYLIYLLLLSVFIINIDNINAQKVDSIQKIIFIPHPRSDDRVNQSVYNTIEYIDFSKFDMKILGGDLTYYTSISTKSLDYCESIFDLDNENTLWAMGNHDLNNKDLIVQYTLRPSYYSYYKDKITYVILNTELDCNQFIYSYISGEQLDFLTNLTDTISNSEYLVIAHHRILWLVNNDTLKSKLDSVGASTREMDTTNFYKDIYPLLQKVKKKGIQVFMLGGDRSDIPIKFSPEDSITMLTSVMVPEFTEEQNHVIVLEHNLNTNLLNWKWVSLKDIEKVPISAASPDLYKKFIFLPHIYDVDTHDVIESIKRIDYSKFDMIMLGGDLNYSTSATVKSMEKLDSLFNLSNPNTLWTLGNHDVDNRENIMEVTKKNTFYSYYSDSVTFLVLDTELDAEMDNYIFKNSFFSGEQLELIKNITDTISKSKYLIIMHYRLVWMIGVPELATYLDSVGKSTYEMDTVNYYQEVYPRLQEVKNRGIEVISLSGDKITTNLTYVPEDSMTFLISTIISDKSDEDNYAIIFKQNRNYYTISWDFVPISEIEKIEIPPDTSKPNIIKQEYINDIKIYPNPSGGVFTIKSNNSDILDWNIEIFDIVGKRINFLKSYSNNELKVEIKYRGIYLIKISNSTDQIINKIRVF